MSESFRIRFTDTTPGTDHLREYRASLAHARQSAMAYSPDDERPTESELARATGLTRGRVGQIAMQTKERRP